MQESVIGITLSKDRRSVLLVMRRDVPGIWTLPGGGIDPGETPEEAVVREILEESRLKVSISRKTALYSPLIRLANTTHVYECIHESGVPSTTDETCNVRFFLLNELPKHFFHIHRDWLEDACKHTKTIYRPIHQVTYPKVAWGIVKNPWWAFRLLMSKLGFPINTTELH